MFPFPEFMQGNVSAKFADGGSAVAYFSLFYGNATFSDDSTGIITMIEPLEKKIDKVSGQIYFVFHECVNISSVLQHRCSLVVPTQTGYIEHLHHNETLIPCSLSN